MGIAYSKGPIYYSEFTPTSKAAMVSALHTGATACGWDATEITGGYDYVLTSPQAGIDKLRVKVTQSGSDGIEIECRSYDELRTGISHFLSRGAFDITVWMNRCQFFIATKGISYFAVPGWGHSQIMGGIPWVGAVSTSESTDSGRDLGLYSPFHATAPVTESWWSAGANGNNFRYTFSCEHSYVGCTNGVMRKHALGDPYPFEQSMPNRAHLALMPITPTFRFPGSKVPATLWNGDPFYVDPWLCWGTPTEPANTVVQGQVWDAIQPSVENPLEDEITFDGLTWKNYLSKNPATGDAYGYYSYYISLYLLKSAPATGHGHYAY